MKRDERGTTKDESLPHTVAFARHMSPLLIWFILGLLLRLALWVQPLHQLANDEIEYVTVARDLLAGRGWVFYEQYHWLRAPLYPLFLAGSLLIAGGDLWLAALPTILLSAATIPLAALLARELAGSSRPLAPTLTAACTAVLWTLATFASLYMSETLFTFLFTSALLLLLRWKRERNLFLLILAAICLGLAILTRSLPLAFLPFILLWIALQGDRRQETGDRRFAPFTFHVSFIPSLVFLLFCLLTIVPWTIRNCFAYGRCITVETGLSYNLWAFNEPREDSTTIFRTLESIPNPADRSDYATARGLERLREDPAILLRKLWPNWTYLWRVNPIIEDRFLLRTYYADPPPLIFLAALLFDDGLMALVTLAGAFGVARIADRRRALLCAGWLLYVVGTTLLTHGEGRYRHFFFPVLIPCAAIAVSDLWNWLRRRDTGQRRGARVATLVALPVAILLLFTIVQTYPWGWAIGGMQRSAWLLVGDVAWESGNVVTAEDAYRRAVAVQERADAWVRLGDAQRARGEVDAAMTSYRAASALSPAYILPGIRRGDLLRAQGQLDEARAVFNIPYADPQQVVDWAWTDLRPASAERIAIGDGLDFGYVWGVYPSEQQQGQAARWTQGWSLLRVAAPASQVLLRLAAPRPDGQQVTVEVCSGQHCTRMIVDATWRTYRVLMPPASAPVRVVEVHSDTFTAPDGRQLGILIDEVLSPVQR